MRQKLKAMSAAAFMALIGSGSVMATCPGTHLQPTMSYGRAFGKPEKVTINISPPPGPRYEEVAFQYFEYQSREPGYSPVFGVHVLKDSHSAKFRVVLGRLSNGKPVLDQAPLDKKTVDLIVAVAAPIVRDTHYQEVPCSASYTDGYLMQAGVAWRGGDSDAKFIGGEAFAPVPGSPADQLKVLGRALRAVASKKMAEDDLQKFLREMVTARSDPPT